MKLSAITDIIWSQSHLDNTEDPSVFPPSTNLVVGPGFRDAIGEGYPQNEDPVCTPQAWDGRSLIELDFVTNRRATLVGRWHAVVRFGNRSFYVLHSPGHTDEHLRGLAHTKLPARSSSIGNGENDRWREAFFAPRCDSSDSHELALRSVSVLQGFNGEDNVLVVFTHDSTLYDVVELYPKDAMGWKDKGWQREGRWRFLEDLSLA
ncbi:hypothetical protein DL764_006683 [Monosporascus ibericus]|uniref:Uncharacterized protein n=1 Tax=Monosporascus ibericus TaxID=155417 RepID=A0A4Q4T463_9PEZI|nr:hypothetical protein DL764_006683 [Monosporascus ibericus]